MFITKIKSVLTGIFIAIATLSLAQTNYTTVTQIDISATPTQSYVVNDYGRILPGTTISAQTNGTFFLRANTGKKVSVPSPDRNFIRTETMLVKSTSESAIIDLNETQKSTTFGYFDGLGREIQTVAVKATPLKNDAVTVKVYDEWGRESTQYLAFASGNTGAYNTDALNTNASNSVFAFYAGGQVAVPTDLEPFNEIIFEASPRALPEKSYGTGWKWHDGNDDKFVTSALKLNDASEVRKLTEQGSKVVSLGYYPENTLTISETTDEGGQSVKKYTDFLGRLIMQRTGDAGEWHDTYHVYDVSGRLRYVIQPEGMKNIGTYIPYTMNGDPSSVEFVNNYMDSWMFQYRYDEYGRQIAKRIPGASGWIYTIYDKWDRPVLTQDPNQAASSQWTFTKYDINNRAILTGFFTGSETSLRSSAMAASTRYESRTNSSVGYTNNAFPTHDVNNLLTITYYDDYAFVSYTGWDAEGLSYSIQTENDLINNTSLVTSAMKLDPVKGQTTGTKVKVLVSGTAKWLNTVNYYNRRYQNIQTISENHLGGLDIVSSLFDELTGKEKIIKHKHTGPTGTFSIVERYDYDHAQRLTKLTHQIEGGPSVVMLQNKYNELGQPIEKNIHSTDNGVNFLQSVDFRYNIRGWITHINNSSLTNDNGVTNDDTGDLFGMQMLYNDTEPVQITSSETYGQKHFDGEISAIKWKTDTRQAGVTPVEQIYGFKYDQFKRFKNAYYAKKNQSGSWNDVYGGYNESVGYYDQNGNIGGGSTAALSRNTLVGTSAAEIDNLIYTYDGNKLTNIVDNANNTVGYKNKPGVGSSVPEFEYDANGNMEFDLEKDIASITYNHLNLPTVIEFYVGGKTNKIEYTYDALGNKLTKIVRMDGVVQWTTDYVGAIQYDKKQADPAKLSFITTSEGRAVFNGTGYDYEYFFKDHQRNVRVVYGSAKETISYFATMESDQAVASYEESTFRNINSTRRSNVYNYTQPTDQLWSPDESVECNGFYSNKIIGPAKMLRVGNGDVIFMEAFARYSNPTNANTTVAASTIVSALTGASTFNIPGTGETAPLYSSFNTNAPGIASSWGGGAVLPKAYLAYLFFDDAYNFVPSKSGAVLITTSAFNAFEKLNRSVEADRSGYLYIYTACETSNNASAGVFFDDMQIIHQKNNTTLQVFQASDYYPYGLSFNEYFADRLRKNGTTYEPILRNRYRFQGQELQSDLDLDWYQYKFRMHDPASGRFYALDPLAEKFLYNSPYAFSENRLINGIELEGAEYYTSYRDPNGSPARGSSQFWGGIATEMWKWTQDMGGLAYNGTGAAWGGAQVWGKNWRRLFYGQDYSFSSVKTFSTAGKVGFDSYQQTSALNSGLEVYGNTVVTAAVFETGGVFFEALAPLASRLFSGISTTTPSKAIFNTTDEISTVFHSTKDIGSAENILKYGFDPSYTSSANRFGQAFYGSTAVETTIAELAAHGATRVNTIQYTLSSSANLFNATGRFSSLAVKYAPKLLGSTVKKLGYDGLFFNSLRAQGTNIALFKNTHYLQFGKIIYP